MLVDLSINPKKIIDGIVSFIKTTVQKTGFSKLIIGLSGGIDSSVSASLAVCALGSSNIHVCLFPYGDLNKKGIEDAKLMIKKLNISTNNVYRINIKNIVDCIIDEMKAEEVTLIRKGNIMVRLRMILLYDLAKKCNALVLGTENKTEHLLGYFTRFGDEASDIEPIRSLYKTQVRQIAKYLEIPEKIIKKSPSAGLWKGQTDEGELGFTYKQADQILYFYTDLKKSREEMVKLGFKKELVDKVLKRLKDNEFKHKVPYVLASSV